MIDDNLVRVSQPIVPTIIEFRTVSPRKSLLTIKVYWFNFTLTSVHTPTEDKTQEEKDYFYDEIMSVIDGIPNHRIVIILDLNTNIEKK